MGLGAHPGVSLARAREGAGSSRPVSQGWVPHRESASPPKPAKGRGCGDADVQAMRREVHQLVSPGVSQLKARRPTDRHPGNLRLPVHGRFAGAGHWRSARSVSPGAKGKGRRGDVLDQQDRDGEPPARRLPALPHIPPSAVNESWVRGFFVRRARSE